MWLSGKIVAEKKDKNNVEVLFSMKVGKAGGPSGITSDLFKLCEQESVKN